MLECIVDWMPDILQAGADIIVALAEGITGALPTLIAQAAVIVSDMLNRTVNNQRHVLREKVNDCGYQVRKRLQ